MTTETTKRVGRVVRWPALIALAAALGNLLGSSGWELRPRAIDSSSEPSAGGRLGRIESQLARLDSTMRMTADQVDALALLVCQSLSRRERAIVALSCSR